MGRIGFCRERQRLLDEYGAAAADLSQRGRALTASAVSYEADLFQRSWDRCEAARARCAEIRRQLMAHMSKHGCELGLFGETVAEE